MATLLDQQGNISVIKDPSSTYQTALFVLHIEEQLDNVDIHLQGFGWASVVRFVRFIFLSLGLCCRILVLLVGHHLNVLR